MRDHEAWFKTLCLLTVLFKGEVPSVLFFGDEKTFTWKTLWGVVVHAALARSLGNYSHERTTWKTSGIKNYIFCTRIKNLMMQHGSDNFLESFSECIGDIKLFWQVLLLYYLGRREYLSRIVRLPANCWTWHCKKQVIWVTRQ